MKITRRQRIALAEELQFAAERMRASTDPFEQVFYFSAGYGEAGRILNANWDTQLSLVHLVLQTTYMTTNSRLATMATPQERAVKLPDRFMAVLADATESLAKTIMAGQDDKLCEVLARLAELAYATTGNGFYLYLKGKLPV